MLECLPYGDFSHGYGRSEPKAPPIRRERKVCPLSGCKQLLPRMSKTNYTESAYYYTESTRCFLSSLTHFFPDHPLRTEDAPLFPMVDPFGRPFSALAQRDMRTALIEQTDTDLLIYLPDKDGFNARWIVTMAYN